jgi:hypothetical protein
MMHLLPAAIRHGEQIGQSFQRAVARLVPRFPHHPHSPGSQCQPTEDRLRIHQLAIADLVPFTDQRRSQLQEKRSAPGGNKDHNLAFPKQLVRMHTIQNWPKLARTGQNWPELARTGQNWPELAKTGQHWIVR